MSNELVPISPEVPAILKGAFGKDGVPMPFVKEIFPRKQWHEGYLSHGYAGIICISIRHFNISLHPAAC